MLNTHVRLAEGSGYIPGTFWVSVFTVVAGVLGTIAVVVATVRRPPRRLLYWMPAVTPLLNTQHAMRGSIEVRRGELILSDPHVIEIGLLNQGRQAIPSAAFDGGRPLRLDVGAPIVELLKSTTAPAGRQIPKTEIEGSVLEVGPSLLGPRQAVSFYLLVDGASPGLTCAEAELTDIDIRYQDGSHDPLRHFIDTRVGRVTIAGLVASILVVLLGAGIGIIARQSPSQAVGSRHNTAPPVNPEAVLRDPNTSGVSNVAFSPDGRTVAFGDFNGKTYVWNVATRSLDFALPNPNGQDIFGIAFSPDGKLLAVATQNSKYDDGDVYLWNVPTRRLAATLHDPRAHGPEAVAFSPDGSILAVGDNNGGTDLWNVATGRRAWTLPDPNGQSVSSVAFSPNGNTLAVSSGPVDTTYLWDVSTHQITATISDPAGGGINKLAFSPDGTTLADADQDGNAYLWNPTTRRLAATFHNPNGHAATNIAFSPDGSTLAVTTNYKRTIGYTYIWNTTTRKLIATLRNPGSKGTTADAFSPDGNTLEVSDGNLNNYLWNMKWLSG